MYSAIYRIALIDSGNRKIALTGPWKSLPSTEAVGGTFIRTRTSGARANLSFTGLQMAVIGNRAPDHGRVDVRLGSGTATPVSVNSAALETRRILYLSPPSAVPATISIEVRNTSSSAQPVVDLDAFLVLTRVQ
jgi:hypothetical protein